MQAAIPATITLSSDAVAADSPLAAKCAYVYDGYQFRSLTPTSLPPPHH